VVLLDFVNLIDYWMLGWLVERVLAGKEQRQFVRSRNHLDHPLAGGQH
jgi:hypothetical protein